MSGSKKKNYGDRIFVKGGDGHVQPRRTTNMDDITLLALQLSCPQRWEHTEASVFENVSEIHNLTAITVETKHFSSLILLGSSSARNSVEGAVAGFTNQLRSIIKSANEKIYFIESFQMHDPTHLEWNFFVRMSDYCFMHETPHGAAFMGYFRLEKTTDEDRFSSRTVDSMSEGEVAEQDLYLYFQKNNRYIKILKKGESLEKKRMDRLQSHGVKDIFVSSDQGKEIQQRRVSHIVMQLLEDYTSLTSVA